MWKNKTATYHCQCGKITGESCSWHGPLDEMVVVEWMPEYLRDSHLAARNSGTWPDNGSSRLAVERSCADLVIESEADPEEGFAVILEGANPADYLDPEDPL